MPWDIITTEAGNGDPQQEYYIDQLTEKIRGVWDRLDRISVQWRRGAGWIPAPCAIAMPKDPKIRKTASPEEGAREIWKRAYAYAEEKQAVHLAFEGFGSSARGDSMQRLFRVQCRPFEGGEDSETNAKGKSENAAIEAARVMTDALEAVSLHLKAQHDRNLSLWDKSLELMGKATENTGAVVEGMRIQQEMEREKHEHEQEIENIRTSHETTEKLLDVVGKPFGNALEKLLARAFNMDGAFDSSAPFAKRLGSIVHAVSREPDGEARLARIVAIMGDDAWDVLRAMSNAADDASFTAQGRRFLELLAPDPQGKLSEIAGVLGQAHALALLRLIQDAGLVT